MVFSSSHSPNRFYVLTLKISINFFLNLDFSSHFTSFILSLPKQVLTLDADLWFTLSKQMFASFLCICFSNFVCH